MLMGERPRSRRHPGLHPFLQTATTDEVMNYCFCREQAPAKQRLGQGYELFSGFVKDKPDNPTVVSALY